MKIPCQPHVTNGPTETKPMKGLQTCVSTVETDFFPGINKHSSVVKKKVSTKAG